MEWLIGLLTIAVAVIIYLIQRRSTQRVEVVNPPESVPSAVQQAIPYVRLVFQKAPEKVLLENIGPGIAVKALLQGFTFKDGQGDDWECTFEAVHTIQFHETVPVGFEIKNLTRGIFMSENRTLFHVAFRHALHVLTETPLILRLVYQDMFGNCYESQVRIDGANWYIAWKEGREHRWAAVTSAPVRIPEWPATLPPVAS